MTVNGTNDGPVAVDDSALIGDGGADTINGSVITNDSDPDGDALSVTQVEFNGETHSFDPGSDSLTIEGDHGTLTINTDGSYTYEKEDGVGGETVTAGGYGSDAGDWSDAGVSISAFDFGTSFTDGNGNFDASLADDSVVVTSEGLGVEGTQGGAQASTQIEYDPNSGDSEALALTFDTSVSSADVTVSRLYSGEGSTGEMGQWQAFDADGNLVATGDINNDTVDHANSNVGTLSIDTGGAEFQTVVFTATQMSGSQSDFKIQGVEYETPGTADGGEDVFTYTISDGEGGTDMAALTVTVEGDVNVAPVAGDSPEFTMNEDGTITISESQLLAGSTDADGDELSVTDLSVNNGEGTLSGPDANGNYTYEPDENFSGEVTLNYNVTDGEESVAQTAEVTVVGVADAPTLTVAVGEGVESTVGGEAVDVSIGMDNVTNTDNGFTVTARAIDENGELTDASADNISVQDSYPQGFGVSGEASGADSELGYDSDAGISEQLIVSFDDSVSSADVSFAWKHAGEDAVYELYEDGVKVGEGTIVGGSDGIDPAVTLSADNGASFDEIVFTAPGYGDDFLINSIDFETGQNAEDVVTFPVEISTALVDTDGSESLSTVTIEMDGMPDGATFSAGALNSDGDWEIPSDQLSGLTVTAPDGSGDFDLTVSVTSTEDNGDAATTTVTTAIENSNEAPVAGDSPEFTMNEDGTLTISEAQLLAGSTDGDGDALSVTDLVVNNGEGTLTGPDANGNYSYAPDENFSGEVTLNYNITDGEESVAQTATVEVAGVADAPTLDVSATLVASTSAETDVPVSL